MTLLDPSFARQDFIFIEGKSKAKLTFGTMKANAWAYVDLDMEPRHAMTITLLQARATYNLPEEVSEEAELFTAGQQLMFKSARDYFVKEMKYLQVLAGIFVLGIIPIFYSKRLRNKRIKLYKSS